MAQTRLPLHPGLLSSSWNPSSASAGALLLNAVAGVTKPLAVNANIARWLHPAQIEVIPRLHASLEAHGGVILNDAVGCGKTVTTIALLSAFYLKTGTAELDSFRDAVRHFNETTEGGWYGRDSDTPAQHYRKKFGTLPPALIVVPTAVVSNWVAELEKWTFFDVATCRTAADVTAAYDGYCEVVVVSHALLVQLRDRFLALKWGVVVVDEVHKCADDTSHLSSTVRRLTRKFCLGLTATLFQNKVT